MIVERLEIKPTMIDAPAFWMVKEMEAKFDVLQKEYSWLFTSDGNKYDPRALDLASTEQLQMLYGLSSPYYAHEYHGSIFLRTYRSPVDKVLTDASDTSYTADINAGARVLNLDFVPFGVDEKIPGMELPSGFLGNYDLLRLAQARFFRGLEFPSVIAGLTNAEAARFAIRHWGFHLAEAVDTDTKLATTGEEAKAILRQSLSSERSSDTHQFGVFTKTSDLFSGENLKRIHDKTKLFWKRIKDTGLTEAPFMDHYERELRIEGVRRNFEAIGVQPVELTRFQKSRIGRNFYSWRARGSI